MTIERLTDLPELITHFPAANQIDDGFEEALSRLEWPGDLTIIHHLARWQGDQAGNNVTLRRPRLAIYAARHAMAEKDGITDKQAILDQIEKHAKESSIAYHLCAQVDADLRLYELDLESINNDPRADGTDRAMDENTASHALAYGMMAVEPGMDILAPAIMAHARPAAKRILDNLANEPNSLDLLCRYGAPDLAAGMGAIVAARMAGCPVVIDDISMLAVAAILARLANGAADHCAVIGTDHQMVDFAKQFNLLVIDPATVAHFGPGENTMAAIPIWRVLSELVAKLGFQSE